MTRLDRYLLAQLIGPFGFFALVFTGILWLTQSLRLIDTVISNGQSASAFLEFSTLVLPNVMVFVIPLSVFAAALYTLNRLYMESELVVVLMSGRSPFSLTRPLLIFGGAGMLGMLAVTLYLLPVSATRLEDRLKEVRTEYANTLVQEGRFMHPSDGVTLYIRDTNTAGEMAGIFLHDARLPEAPITYSANRAVLVRQGEQSQIVMFDGVAQKRDVMADAFETVTFERFAYDLTEFLQRDNTRIRKPREFFVSEALHPDETMIAGRYTRSDFIAEGHDKIVFPLLTFTLPLLALGGVLAGSFRRSGLAVRMSVAIGLLVVVQISGTVTKSIVADNWVLWPIAYTPVLLGLVMGGVMLWMASRSKSRKSGP